ncbi:MAG: hypothetical protein FJ137_04795 [Deltaproteobacteria bacterium]|nr:hypothetical protein [Deltaproteobacteria bacterium]
MTRSTRRGYLLVESAVAGGLLVAAMGVALALVVQGRAAISAGSNRATAAALLRSKTDEIASQTTCNASSSLVDVGAGFAGFQWSWQAASAAAMNDSNPPLTTGDAPLCAVAVTVEYPTTKNGTEDGTDGVTGNARARLQLTKMWRP